MSKHRQISRVLKNELYSMSAFGESKAAYRSENQRLEGKIFSKGTMDSYVKSVGVFERYCIEKFGTSRISMDTAKSEIQEFVYWCRDKKNFSPNTIHTHLAAVCKAFHEPMTNYDKPRRCYAENTRGTKGAIRDSFNEHRAAEALDLNATIGVRRSELGRLKCSDITIDEHGDIGLVRTIGKGGKPNINVLLDKKEVEKVQAYIDEARAAGRKYIFSKEQMKHDANLHQKRAERANYIYEYVKKDIENDPSARGRWQGLIKQVFHENGKVLKENLDRPYIPRGKGREKLISEGKPLSYDRTALMAASVFCLNHFRSDVSFQNYVFKN